MATAETTATTTTAQASSSAIGTASNDVRSHPAPIPSKSWSCSACKLSFDSGQAQRQHMKEPWHVYNIKRRIASLPPISLETFNQRVQPRAEVSEEPLEEVSEEDAVDEADQDAVSPYQCLFCQQDYGCQDESLSETLSHMLTVHGLFIPHQELISDIETFLGYLGTQVRVWHECLYCGTTRDSTLGLQSHMRDRGHCMLNLDREPELMDFWEGEQGEEGFSLTREERSKLKSSDDEVQLSSGKVVASKQILAKRIETARARENRLVLRAKSNASMEQESSQQQNPQQQSPQQDKQQQGHRQLARRDVMGIQGVNNQQRLALLATEKRTQKQEEVATRAREWARESRANKQKHDQAHGPLSWAKGGLHNLLPR